MEGMEVEEERRFDILFHEDNSDPEDELVQDSSDDEKEQQGEEADGSESEESEDVSSGLEIDSGVASSPMLSNPPQIRVVTPTKEIKEVRKVKAKTSRKSVLT